MEDPLFNYWGLSLFPQSTSISPSNIPYDSHHDLHQIHNHLKPMALANPGKLLDEAKSILDANPDLLNSQNSNVPPSAETNDVPEESQDQEFPRRRRPALGLKRGRFSLKPTKNTPVENLLPTLDLDKLKDPVEFFLAHERLENAKREIQKQMGGVSFESNGDNTSNKPRQRRPELPGNNQRPVRYKHRYPKETFDSNAYVPSSQEIIGSDSHSPVGENTDKGGSNILDPVGENPENGEACLTSLENEVTGVDLSAKEDVKLNDLLDGLLHCSPEDLEGDGAMTLLQERLQIKPIVLEELSVPDFPVNKMIDLKSLQGNLSKPRKALSNIDNLLKGMNKTPLKQGSGSPAQQLASPTPPRSPFAALSSLQRHISRSKPSVDPFSAVEIVQLSARNNSPAPMINQELDLVGSGNPSNEQNEHIIEDVIAVSKPSSVVNIVSNKTGTSEESKKGDFGKSSDMSNVPLPEETIATSETALVEDTIMNFASTSMEDNAGEPGFDANADSNECHVDMDVDVGGSFMCEGPMNDKEDRPNFEGIIKAPAASVPMADLDFNLVSPQADQSNPAGFQASARDKCTRKEDDVSEKCVQEKPESSLVPVNGQRKAKLRSQKQRQSEAHKLSRRQSLAAAGTSWNSGLRRSTRNRTRPLEYWKGERMVYGRIHDSLATVIGVKCMSPGTDGKPTLKVKSYVSDKYKELLELASLH
ncbi:PREDICTED: uncharacterized protein LOC109351196 isoform X4 [Lupinus angustifolius]|uniref:uncharacterized protein LOC109351196 isoform X4 n=1 Tax=Lupinus angustifolius TaxID=3871 RepID=UPI00092EE538|nr:PREDICTED: uncharacterized protein LOC109351196 isoform X4 [Lupinus angustifolius]